MLDGPTLGRDVGKRDGISVVGAKDGPTLGMEEGARVGASLGPVVGIIDGSQCTTTLFQNFFITFLNLTGILKS